MTDDEPGPTPDLPNGGTERELLVRLGAAMTVAGDSIDDVGQRLTTIARARGLDDISVVVLPTALFVQTGHGASTAVQLEAFTNQHARLDQIGELYELVERVQQPSFDPSEGIEEVDRILRARPTFGPLVRTFGIGVLSVGFSLSLQPTLPGVAAAFVLGVFVGLLHLLRLPGLRAVLPVLATFLVSTIVFATAESFGAGNPIRTLIPPLVTFLPGAVLTTGMRDLSAGQVVSGASRLVQGVVVLALLAFGVVAAATLVGTPSAELLDRPVTRLGPWAPWVGLLFVALGAHLHHCAPRRAVPWILAVLVIAYSAQTVSAVVFTAELSPFFGALAMTPAVLWFERLPHGPPSLVTFLPAFWLLVPGAAGLIGVTEIVGTDSVLGPTDFVESLGTVIEIALGVLIGTAMFRTGAAGLEGAVKTLPPVVRRPRWPGPHRHP
jgi:uncharacterized membrane protein YjjP (DUF1212 family)